MSTDHLSATLAAIDKANAADPNHAADGTPEALLYGQRMSDELARLVPDASDLLQVAVRGQHIERWTSPRASYPEGREGYLAWRRDLGAFHATRVAEIMEASGYGVAEAERAGRMLRKEGIKRDPDVQALEDVACLTFLRWYFLPFAASHDESDISRIVQKTARKMSPRGRARALSDFDLPESLAAAFRE